MGRYKITESNIIQQSSCR